MIQEIKTGSQALIVGLAGAGSHHTAYFNRIHLFWQAEILIFRPILSY
jgi:hypothetical protein